MKPRRVATAVALIVGLAALAVVRSSSATAAPGDALPSFGSGGLWRVTSAPGCSPCPTPQTSIETATLATTATTTAVGWDFRVPAPDGTSDTEGTALSISAHGASPVGITISGADAGVTTTILAVGIVASSSEVVVVVGLDRRAALPAGDVDEGSVQSTPLGQEIRRFSLTGTALGTVALPDDVHGSWSLAAVAPDGSVAGVVDTLVGDDDLPRSTVRRHSVSGAFRWERSLAVGDAIEDVDIGDDGRVVVSGSRWDAPEETFHGLLARLTDAGAPDPAFGSSGVFLSTAPSDFGRSFMAVDVVGADVAAVGDDQFQGDEGDAIDQPGGLVVARLRDGQPLASFSGDGLVERSWSATTGLRVLPSGVLVDGERTIVSGNLANRGAAVPEAALIRYLGGGTVDDGFQIDGTIAPELGAPAAVPGGYVTPTPALVDANGWHLPVRAFASGGPAATAPAPPTGIKVDKAGSGSATVSWTPPTAAITGYDLLVDADGDGAPDTAGAIPKLTTLEVPDIPGARVVRFALRSRAATGVGPRSAWSAPAIPPFRTLDAFSDRQYRDMAGRAPTATEIAAWRTSLGNGSLAPPAAIEGLLDAPAWSGPRSPVVRIYRAYFLRLPDTSGLEYWVGRRSAGTSLNDISAAFAGSREFRERYGTLTNRQFVERVYLNVLGRPGESSGVTFWTSQLDQRKRTRGQVMTGFSESVEYKAKTKTTVELVNTYSALLRRVPTTGEAALWIPPSGQPAPRSFVISYLFTTPEYDTRIP